MPKVTFSKKEIEKIIGKKLPIEQLKDRISMIGTDLENIEGDEITVEIFPNRPDWLSEQGFGRSLASFLGTKKGLRKYTIKKSNYKVIVDSSVTMRPYTVCAVVKKITFTDQRIKEIMQMQEKLATTHGRNRKKSAYGIYPLKNIHFPIKYIAKDPNKVMFQPLGHDKKIPAIQVEELHKTGKAYKHIAQDWKKYPFFIDSKENVMCMLPYTNSQDTGKVELDTHEIFIECTGTNLANIKSALNMFVTMFADMGGEIHSVEMICPEKKFTSPDLTPTKMKIDITYVNKILELNLKEKDMKQLLEKMGYGYEKGHALIPAYRADILHQVDLIEDIAIAYGYENFEEEIPNVSTIGQEDPFEILLRKIKEIIVGRGFIETETFHLSNKKILAKNMMNNAQLIKLQNSISEDFDYLRHSLLPQQLEILSKNTHNEYPQNIFSTGKIFLEDTTTETGIREEKHLVMLLCHAKTDYTAIRQEIEHILKLLDKKCTIKTTEHPSFISGRTATIFYKNKEIGTLGEIRPQVLENFGLNMPVVGCEINLEDFIGE
ncbi:phenylalanine--tRNA ligase subunit beta [Candidatus Woesearchaeota archaeon CG10_big_fil_rev_8_21_14_0_10_37_12]|nr:MAG: phenylalanine--tRNA ligase subunit beta [Candidatus Woesearchaeota archaeon CG10_big_fil_rev_8_21_14_0_10_37_12]